MVTHPEMRIGGASSQGAGRRARAVADTESESMRRRSGAVARPDRDSEGEVVVGRVVGSGGGRGVANGAPVAHEGLTQGAGAQADGMGERDDRPLLAGIVEVVDEGH